MTTHPHRKAAVSPSISSAASVLPDPSATSLRRRTAWLLVLICGLLVGVTDAVLLHHQSQQRSAAFEAELLALPQVYGEALAGSLDADRTVSEGTRQLLQKLQARPGVLALELKTAQGLAMSSGDPAARTQPDVRQIEFELGPPASGGALLQVLAQEQAMQQAFWREAWPAIVLRDLLLVLLLSLSAVAVLDRMMLRPLRRLADRADALDSDQSPLELLTGTPPGQPAELSRVSRSLMRAHHGLWLRWQEEVQQVQQLQQQVQSQAAQLHAAAQSLEQKERELGSLSRSDELTGLANRREFDEALRREFKRAQRQRGQLALAVLDLDHFKRYNERHGAAAGDQALQRFAQLLSERFKRDTDFVARLGGEEFVALLPGFGLDVTQELMEQLREELRNLHLPQGSDAASEGPGLTVSIGLAAYSPAHPYLSPQALMQAADEALYIAKHAGRDRLSLASSLSSLSDRS